MTSTRVPVFASFPTAPSIRTRLCPFNLVAGLPYALYMMGSIFAIPHNRSKRPLLSVSAIPPSLQKETTDAAQGSWRLLIGRRDAPGYFDTSPRGLVSSFIALLVSIAVTLGIAALTRSGMDVSSLSLVVTNAVLYAALVGASWIVLRMIGKADKFIPFLAVDNWLNAFISIALAVAGLVGLSGEAVMFGAIVAGLAARINNARLVAELNFSQIVLLMVTQVVGVVIGLGVLGMFIPAPAQ